MTEFGAFFVNYLFAPLITLGVPVGLTLLFVPVFEGIVKRANRRSETPGECTTPPGWFD